MGAIGTLHAISWNAYQATLRIAHRGSLRGVDPRDKEILDDLARKGENG